LGVRGLPLLGAGRALGQFPVEVEEVVEVPVVPLRGLVGPRALEAAGDGVGTLAGAKRVRPAEALVLDRARLRFRADQVGVAGTVALPERVAAGDEGDRLLVVHGHATEGLPD